VNHLDAALAARAFRSGRALRAASRRHRRLVPRPLAVVLWQLGAEPFAAAALGWGDRADGLETVVAGEPRNRDLAFAALLRFARWFNPRFEAHAADRETFSRGDYRFTRARTALQVLVTNAATVEMLGRLGRRLAYLPTTGPQPADEALVRLGRHLRFLWGHWSVPGQQLLVSLTDLLNTHWATAQSPLERQSLAALDAYVDPPAGEHGYEAAARAERTPVGPVPDGDDDERLGPLVERFNERRGGSTALAVVGPLLGPIEAHYHPLLRNAWELLWRCRDREAELPEARSVTRRWDEDRDAYTRHMDWMARSGLRRTRQTPRQAAMALRHLEEARRLLEAEEACDDPVRMIPYLLQGKAVRGRVLAVDPEYRERAAKAMVRRPLVTLRSPDPCLIPEGRELWWAEQPDGREFVIHAARPGPGGGALVTLKLMTSNATTGLPMVGNDACFSVHNTSPGWRMTLPRDDPWTHQPSPPPADAAAIEEDERGG
jgi:hypothetical protein